MRITSKLGLLVALPLVAVLAFAWLAVSATGGEAVRADGLRRLVAAGTAAGELVHGLQLERAEAVLVLTGASAEPGGFRERAAATDRAVRGFRQAERGLPRLPAAAAGVLTRVGGQLEQLEGLREGVDSGSGRASATGFSYRILMADLIGFRELVGQAGGAPADVADRLRAASALSRAAEAVGLQQVAVLRAASFGPLTAAAAQEVTAARAARVEALQTFDAFAPPSWRLLLVQGSAAGDEPLTMVQLEDQVARTRVGGRLQLDLQEWAEATAGRMGRLRQVEAAADADLLAEVGRLRDARRLAAGVQVGGVAAAVAGAVGLAWVWGRPVVRGLRRLRDSARRVAHQDLPQAVQAMEQREDLGGLSPDEFAQTATPAVPVRGRDELAEVGAAFNLVHRVAVRTAAEQAMQRLHMASIMQALARRGQRLTDRLTAALDDVERDELDPRRLAQLYALDLAATLLGGTNESLLVLGGGGAAVVREADEPLSGVLHAALGRVEQYQRVELRAVDEGVNVRADAVDDVVKLLAELLDNACRFSPPHLPVEVSARWLSDRVVVQVLDQGAGIDAGRRALLNTRLRSRPPLDLQAVQAMGLTVVAYIAHRHGIGVELRAGYEPGTLAEATLPGRLVALAPGRSPRVVPEQRLPAPASVSAAAPVMVRADGHAGGYPVAGARPWPSAPPTGAATPALGQLPRVATRLEVNTASAQAPTEPLPIYDSLPKPSHWFAPAGGATAAAGVRPRQAAAEAAGQGAGSSWQTAADAGWRAAERAADPQPVGVTQGGLPVRRPGAQLVPGGVNTPAATSGPRAVPVHAWRDPARAGAVAAAYSRGLVSGRGGHTTVARSHPVERQGDLS